MIVLAVLLAVPGIVLCLPLLSDLLSLVRRREEPPGANRPTSGEPPRFLFLVLAHDEELLLGATVGSLRAQRYPADRRDIVVVADNCSDRTAAVGRAAGATVWERTDPVRRGKPFAIAWALERTDLAAFDGVVIIDADTAVDEGFAAALAARGPSRDRVLQPFIAVRNPRESAITRMAAVHGIAAHGIAYRVKERAGVNVPLGVGMCLGTDVLRAEPWRAFSIAEDYELFAILTARGVRIVPVPEARISAQEAKSLGQSGPQRHRWMAGKLEVLLRHAPTLWRSRRIAWPARFDAIAELLGVGPAVHLALATIGASAAWLLGVPGRGIVAGIHLASLVRPVTYTMLAVARDPAPLEALRAFAFLPVYALWRLGPALGSVLRVRGNRWRRTDRHAEQADRPARDP